MAAALGALGWSPRTFWRATPAEAWAALEGRAETLGARQRRATVSRADLGQLMARFPD